MDVPNDNKVKLVTVCFKIGAAVSWEQTCAVCVRQQKRPVCSWRKMSQLIGGDFHQRTTSEHSSLATKNADKD